ncbi:DUF2167 domain-containing protein [Flavihumibacter stibioxidans]|uniref:DUF2167 domain-containing protein n=1 Tax=Flavihumibacter stibioxidans TaxID=1834163 RepID=A0ABR7M7X6_9BACT|nr:DUF2167 domain-containing protein [Flavihumibacter stibioxidans]MBC6491131.1 hypothetical protein [Flavihumibacter stibioxidans]
MRKLVITSYALLFSICSMALPEDSTVLLPQADAPIIEKLNHQLDSLENKIKYHTGNITLAGGKFTLRVPDEFLFIDANQSRYILEELWGNLPDPEVDGMIVRKGFQPSRLINDYSFVIGYSDIGHVSSQKVTELNHDKLLAQLKENMDRSNESRINMGLNTMSVTGWVIVPYFDQYKKALYWATRINANGTEEEILNYNLRLMGKTGVIKINAVATLDQLPDIKKTLPLIIAQTRFTAAEAFDAYKEGEDRESHYDMASLIAGKPPTDRFGKLDISWQLVFLVAGLSFLTYRVFSNLKRKAAPATA